MRGVAWVTIFDSEQRVLLCHRRDLDAWQLPQGEIEGQEAPWEAAVRQAREWAGATAEPVRLTGEALRAKPTRFVVRGDIASPDRDLGRDM
jgi:8-oxo-dGTP pyrophosphatase MutT (NUDIX family)